MPQDWINALAGGALIGLSATILLLVNGRVTGISGIFYGILKPVENDTLWRVKFVLGLLIGGLLASLFIEDPFLNTSGRSMPYIAAAGLLVGFGTRLGSGCTSGHGVCGISRLSVRSLIATGVFIITGAVTVTLISRLVGGI